MLSQSDENFLKPCGMVTDETHDLLILIELPWSRKILHSIMINPLTVDVHFLLRYCPLDKFYLFLRASNW